MLLISKSTRVLANHSADFYRRFTGGLPGKLAVRGNRGEQCAVCDSCKRLVCNDLL
jgi:hypothetical protein